MRKRKFWITTCIVVAVAAGTVWLVKSRKSEQGEVAPSGEVVTVERGSVRKTVTADGVLRPLTTVEVKSYAGGNVDELAVDVGDAVNKGDLIAKIDPTDSLSSHRQAMADLSVAQANLTRARAQLEVQDTLTSADIAQAVAGRSTAGEDLGRLLDATQPLTRAQAQAGLDQAEAGLDAAQRDLERLRESDHPLSLSEAESSLDRQNASLEVAERDLERLLAADQPQAVATAKAALDKATAALESAKRNLDRLSQAGHPQAVVQSRSSLSKAQSELDVATRELERARALRAEGLIPASELDVVVATYESRQADFEYASEVSDTLAPDQASEIRSSQLAVAQAEADVDSATERWRTLQQQQAAEARSAQAKVDQAKADLVAGSKRMSTIGGAQAADIRVAEAKVNQAEAELAAARVRWRTLDREEETDTGSAHNKVSEAQAALDRAEAQAVEHRLREAEVTSAQAQVQKAEAAVESAATILDYTTILAPREGVILERYVEEGTIVTSGRSSVSTGTTIVKLGDLTSMFVDVQVDETDLDAIYVGQVVEVHIEAHSEEMVPGSVTGIDPQALTEQNITTVLVEVEITEPDPAMLPGLTASCDFMVGEEEGVLRLPRRAVDVNDEGHTVRIMVGEEMQRVPVEIGLEGDEYTEVTSGVNEGDEVIVPKLGSADEPQVNRGQEMGRRMGGGGFAGGR